MQENCEIAPANCGVRNAQGRRGRLWGAVKEESGILALEATISMTFFIFFMLALYSLTTLFMAQYMIGHALSESCQSLSLETYGTDTLGNKWSLGGVLNRFIQTVAGGGSATGPYSSNDMWFKDTYTSSAKVQEICKSRFAAYIGGGQNPSGKADSILKAIGVKNGLDGMDFSETKLDGSDLTISVTYKIRLIFGVDRLGLGDFDATQSVCSRIWGSPSL